MSVMGFETLMTAVDFYRFDSESPVWSIVKYVLTIAAVVVALIVLTERVKPGQKALRLRFSAVTYGKDGQAKTVDPGLRWLMPGMHKLLATSVQFRVVPLEPQIAVGADGYTYDVRATLGFQVVRLDAALVDYEDLEAQLTMIGSAALSAWLALGRPAAEIQQHFCSDPLLVEEAEHRGANLLGLKITYWALTQESRLAMAFKVSGLDPAAIPAYVATLSGANHLAKASQNGHAPLPIGGSM
jgi:hypothetical protein